MIFSVEKKGIFDSRLFLKKILPTEKILHQKKRKKGGKMKKALMIVTRKI
jgi:hypothetical protein